MDNGIYVAASGSLAQERAMDIISNNLANMNTNGYKADRMLFSSYVQKSLNQRMEAPSPEEIKKGFFSKSADDIAYMVGSQSYTDFSQGALQATANSLDIALDGKGFLAVCTPQGELYTRGGSLKVDNRGYLLTSDGHEISGVDNGPINVGQSGFTIHEDGTVFTGEGKEAGKLKLVNFEDTSQLKKEGMGLYSAEGKAKAELSDASVRQGFLESSNINPIAEMTRMITAQRTYDAFSKSVRSHDEMTTQLISNVAR